jgi:hypothetical protein
MPAKSLFMRKIGDVLRFKWGNGMSNRQPEHPEDGSNDRCQAATLRCLGSMGHVSELLENML